MKQYWIILKEIKWAFTLQQEFNYSLVQNCVEKSHVWTQPKFFSFWISFHFCEIKNSEQTFFSNSLQTKSLSLFSSRLYLGSTNTFNSNIIFVDDESSAGNNRRTNERKEQYKQVRAHVKQDDGRMQAYGWSVPASSSKSGKIQQHYISKAKTLQNKQVWV